MKHKPTKEEIKYAKKLANAANRRMHTGYFTDVHPNKARPKTITVLYKILNWINKYFSY